MMKYLNISCLFIFYVLTWDALHNLIIKADGAGRMVFLFGIIIIFKSLFMEKDLFSKPLIYYFAWLIYMFINSSMRGVKYFDNSYYILFSNIFLSFAFFVIVLNEALINRSIILNTIIFSLFVYLGIVAAFNGIDIDDRTDSALNANAVGMRAAFLLFFIFLKYAYKEIGIKITVFLCIFPTLMVFLTQSRTAFGVMFILFLSFIYILWQRINRGIRLFLVIFSLISTITLTYIVLNYTSLGGRLSKTTTQASDNKLLTTGTNWDYLGDRGLQYVLAGPIIRDNFVFGIGLRNFLDYSVTGTVLHSEYLINLCEGGLIGFVLYLLFQYWFGDNLLKIWKANNTQKQVTIVFIAGFISFFFLSWVTRVCYYPFYYGYYGMLVVFINENKIRQKYSGQMKLIVQKIKIKKVLK